MALCFVDENAVLVVIGDGEGRPKYQHLAKSLGLDERIVFLGSINHRALPDFYRASDVFVLPSTSTENASLAILEAMATGLPVIATRVGGTRQLIDDGVNGLLVPPMNARVLANRVNLLLGNPDLCNEIGSNAYRSIRNRRSWQQVAREIEGVFEEAICEFA